MTGWITNAALLGIILSALAVGFAFANTMGSLSTGASLLRDIILAFFSSAAGAVGGAYASQRIADRSAVRKSLTDEIRAANAAHTLAATVFSSSINLLQQFALPLKTSFDDQRAHFVAGKAPLPTHDCGWSRLTRQLLAPKL